MSPELIYQHLSDALRNTNVRQIRHREFDDHGGMCAGWVMVTEVARMLDVPVFFAGRSINPEIWHIVPRIVFGSVVWLNDQAEKSFAEIADIIDRNEIHPTMTEAEQLALVSKYPNKFLEYSGSYVPPTISQKHYFAPMNKKQIEDALEKVNQALKAAPVTVASAPKFIPLTDGNTNYKLAIPAHFMLEYESLPSATTLPNEVELVSV